MDRLTEKHYGGNGYYMRCSGVLKCDGACGDCDELEKVIDRLAAYEDTGLEPEEVVKNYLTTVDISEMGGIDHLRELAQARKQAFCKRN